MNSSPTSAAESARARLGAARPRSHGAWIIAVLLAAVALQPTTASAGMPSFTLTDLTKARLEVISFFLVAMLLLAWGFKAAWNVLARDVDRLPRLRYRSALGLMVVAGLLLGLILSMITGARELMTPGAWTKVGATHQLNFADASPKQWVEATRRQGIERVHSALTTYALGNDGLLPTDRFADGIDPWTWRVPGPHPGLYAYHPPPFPVELGDPVLERWLLAWEPDHFGDKRLVLLGNGSTVEMTPAEIRTMVRDQNLLGMELAEKRRRPTPAADDTTAAPLPAPDPAEGQVGAAQENSGADETTPLAAAPTEETAP